MIKKILCLLLLLIMVTGCDKYSEKSIVKELNKKFDKSSAYKLVGDLEITNNDDVYNYEITANFKKDDYYRIELTNKANSHTQIILKNDSGVYILTPSLNKSFKFQSDWPYSNSQIYLLNALINDVNNDEQRKFSKEKNGYSFITTVNYPNNKNLSKQKIELDNNLKIKKVTVYDKNDVICMKMVFNTIDYTPNFKKNYFDLNTVMDDKNDNVVEKQTGNFEEAIYPLFLPSGTKLVDEEKIKVDNGDRVIMTFDGEKPFLLVEENATTMDEFTVIPTYGEPYRLMDSLGVMTDNSLSWESNGIEYYLVSDVLNQDELIEIAQSIYSLPTMK